MKYSGKLLKAKREYSSQPIKASRSVGKKHTLEF